MPLLWPQCCLTGEHRAAEALPPASPCAPSLCEPLPVSPCGPPHWSLQHVECCVQRVCSIVKWSGVRPLPTKAGQYEEVHTQSQTRGHQDQQVRLSLLYRACI